MHPVIALLFLIFQAAGQSITTGPTRTVQVRSYVRKEGTVVQAYTRAAPGTGTAPRSTVARRAFRTNRARQRLALHGRVREMLWAMWIPWHVAGLMRLKTCSGSRYRKPRLKTVGAERLRTPSNDSACRASLRTFDTIMR
jgi:hypothetical protein